MAKKRMEIELKAGLFVGIGVFLMMLAIIVLVSSNDKVTLLLIWQLPKA
jgi:hypothetical protein